MHVSMVYGLHRGVKTYQAVWLVMTAGTVYHAEFECISLWVHVR